MLADGGAGLGCRRQGCLLSVDGCLNSTFSAEIFLRSISRLSERGGGLCSQQGGLRDVALFFAVLIPSCRHPFLPGTVSFCNFFLCLARCSSALRFLSSPPASSPPARLPCLSPRAQPPSSLLLSPLCCLLALSTCFSPSFSPWKASLVLPKCNNLKTCPGGEAGRGITDLSDKLQGVATGSPWPRAQLSCRPGLQRAAPPAYL